MVAAKAGTAAVSDREGGHTMTEQRSDRKTPAAAMSEQFTQKPPEDVIEEMEAERRRRLDPQNRPDGAEVDNTHREFDSEAGMFTDAPGYAEVAHGDKPYDDDAGEMKAPDRGSTTGTETSEESTA
jgi:hypothetical protein